MKRKVAYVGVSPATYQRQNTKRVAVRRRVPTNIPMQIIRPAFIPQIPRGRMGGSRSHEIKYVDFPTTQTNFQLATAPPTATSLCFPVQGAAAFNRIGQKILLKSIRLRGNVKNILTGVQGFGRIMVVYDRQSNAALPNWADLISAQTSAGATSTSAYDGMNMANRERFIMLVDEQFNFPSVTNTAGVLTNTAFPQEKDPSMFNFDRFVPLKDMEMHFNNTNGGTFADIQTGSLSLFVAIDSNSTAASWQLNWTARTRFDDV